MGRINGVMEQLLEGARNPAADLRSGAQPRSRDMVIALPGVDARR